MFTVQSKSQKPKMAHHAGVSVSADRQARYDEEHTVHLQALHRKYDIMLDLLEFMANLNMVGSKNATAGKSFDEFKLLLSQTRNGLDTELGEYAQGDECVPDEVSSRE